MPKPPRFRLPASFVSPAALLIIGGVVLFVSQEYMSDDEMEKRIIKEYPQVNQDARAKDAAMVALVQRVIDGDPREQKRLDDLLYSGRSAGRKSRAAPTLEDIKAFGEVPELSDSFDKYDAKVKEEAMAAKEKDGEKAGAGLWSKFKVIAEDPLGGAAPSGQAATADAPTKVRGNATGEIRTVEVTNGEGIAYEGGEEKPRKGWW